MARENEVRLIAYIIWEEEGCLEGRDCEHWLRAEAIWEERQKQKATTGRSETEPKKITQKERNVISARKKKS